MTVLCKICNGAVTPTVPAIKCSSCAIYFHIKCIGIDKAHFDIIKSLSGVFWKCENCRSLNNTTEAGQCNCCKLLPNLVETINKLSETVNTLQQQLLNFHSDRSNGETIIQEVNEKHKQAKNIIIFGSAEKADVSIDEQIEQDRLFIHQILEQLNLPVQPNELNVHRIGRRNLVNLSPRPIRITLKSESDVHMIVRKFQNLRNIDLYKNISMNYDKTPKQIAYYKSVKQELTDRISRGEANLKIKYINGTPKIVTLN
ncbi:hypothetical protein Zmor_002419 [Zophobas morio]|uniref:PHD-type domain-containing protein n=1 Tax=Zophobas morio TaxID=2755281 RepID=A0AA38J4V0_9CUCU|nr:hypothetical protein Zmor_002419 [Zophobas morio]